MVLTVNLSYSEVDREMIASMEIGNPMYSRFGPFHYVVLLVAFRTSSVSVRNTFQGPPSKTMSI